MLAGLIRRDLPLHLSLANILGYGLTFVSTLLIARGLGPIGRGETAAALSAFAIAPAILGIGLPLELRRRAAAGDARRSIRAARDLVLFSLLPALALGAIFTTTAFSGVSAELRLLAVVGLTLASISVSWAVDTGVLIGSGRYRAVFCIRVTHPMVTLLVMATAWWLGALTAATVLIASMAGTLATGALGLALCRVSPLGKRANRRELLAKGLTYAGSTIAESASARLDQVLVLPLIGATAAGHYSVAASLALLPLALGQSLAADHFRVVAASDDPRSNPRVQRALHESFSVALPACTAFVLVAAALVPVVFGADFAPSAPVLLALLPGSVSLTVGYVASMLLAAQGRGRTMTVIQVGGLTLGIALLLILGPLWSAIGAAVASAASSLAILVAQMIALRVAARVALPTSSGLLAGLRSLIPTRDAG